MSFELDEDLVMMAKIDDIEVDNPFVKEDGITDIALLVEKKRLYVSKVMLSTASPVFKKMFSTDFKEKGLTELPLPGKKYKAVLEFLNVIYPNIQKPLNFDTVTLILPLVHEYSCERQLEECQKFLTRTIIPGSKGIPRLYKLLECLLQSNLYGLAESYRICLNSVSEYSLRNIKSNTFFKNLPDAVKADLYEKRLEQFETMGKNIVEAFISIDKCKSVSEFKNFGLFLDTKFRFESYGCHFGDFFKK